MNRQKLITTICLVVLAVLVLTWILLSVFSNRDPQSESTPSISFPTNPDGPFLPSVPEKPGQVRLYTCDAELYAVYLTLAERYHAETGLTVTVLAPEEGSCPDTLDRLLQSDAPPTIFCIHDPETLESLLPRLADLSDRTILRSLSSPIFALRQDGKAVAMAIDVAAYGLLCNAELLGKAGFSRDYFTDMAMLSNAVSHISSNRGELGFSPFGTVDVSQADHQGLACLLLMMYREGDDLRSFLDIYRKNALQNGTALDQFLNGKTVFLPGSTADFSMVSGLTHGAHNLDILPVLNDDGAGMQYVCQLYWALDGQASPEDLLAAETFLQWMATAGEQGTPVDALGLMTPFRDATYYENVLQRKLRGYMSSGAGSLSFPCQQVLSDETLDALCQALEAYLAAPSDDTWAAVAALLT